MAKSAEKKPPPFPPVEGVLCDLDWSEKLKLPAPAFMRLSDRGQAWESCCELRLPGVSGARIQQLARLGKTIPFAVFARDDDRTAVHGGGRRVFYMFQRWSQDKMTPGRAKEFVQCIAIDVTKSSGFPTDGEK